MFGWNQQDLNVSSAVSAELNSVLGPRQAYRLLGARTLLGLLALLLGARTLLGTRASLLGAVSSAGLSPS